MGAASTTPRAQASNWALPSSCNLKLTRFGTWGCNVGANGRKTEGLRRVRVRVWQRVGLIRAGPYWNPNPKSDPRRTLPESAQIAGRRRRVRQWWKQKNQDLPASAPASASAGARFRFGTSTGNETAMRFNSRLPCTMLSATCARNASTAPCCHALGHRPTA